MKKLTSLILITAFYINAFSQTNIPAGNVAGTWTANNSPYLITGDVTIAAGSVLNIEPNVIVEFQGFYKIAVEGQLLAVGENNSLITFTINDTTGYSNTDTTIGGWHGIRFENNISIDTSKIIFCKIEFCKLIENYEHGSAIFAENFYYLKFENSLILNNFCKDGSIIYTNNTNLSFNNNKINYNDGLSPTIIIRNINYINCYNNNVLNNQGTGLRLWQVSNAHIVNNLICNNSYSGIWIDASSACEDIILANNTICNNTGYNAGGVFMDELYTVVKFYNNILWNNTLSDTNGVSIGVISNVSGVNQGASFNNCNIQNGISSLVNESNIVGYENNIESNPQFILPTTGVGHEYDALIANWQLMDTSPCIDAGTQDTTGGVVLNIPAKDLAGNTRIYNDTIDIGAYEYSGDVGVNTLKQSDYFNVYPNPVDETITVLSMLKKTESAKIKIISQSGEELYNENLGKVNHISKEINISNYPAGVYSIHIQHNSTFNIVKLIKL